VRTLLADKNGHEFTILAVICANDPEDQVDVKQLKQMLYIR
tara:strand:+ start:65 stop:187 length:123 start_codon:yes stop_codon:yes gene_type:complete